ncbi:MAG: PEBP family protein [Roseobacter sp.]
MKPILTSLALLSTTALPLSAETLFADVWADNWFEMRVNSVQVAKDSVPITTERSFNAESFTFQADRPFVLGLVAKDFKENDTGLEYIGSRRQQMGDGGVIVQIKDATNGLVAASNGDWQCIVIHSAPLAKSCESEKDPVAGKGPCTFEASGEPKGWDRADFNANDWPQADIFSAREVGPKDGYNEIDWFDDAKLIWGR